MVNETPRLRVISNDARYVSPRHLHPGVWFVLGCCAGAVTACAALLMAVASQVAS